MWMIPSLRFWMLLTRERRRYDQVLHIHLMFTFQETVEPQVSTASAFSLVGSDERISPSFIPSSSAGRRQTVVFTKKQKREKRNKELS